MARTGLTYSLSEFDTQRYRRLEEIAAEIVGTYTDLSAADILKAFQVEAGYATVKVDVRGAMVRGNRILLVQERRDRKWCLPGGWADIGETPSEMVAREIVEESGFTAQATRIVGVYDANRTEPMEFFHAYKIVFLCEILGGEPRTSNETMGVDFFAFDDLPPLSSNRTNGRHLADIQACLGDPHRPGVFD
jgi:ADP-ribose pyrophosphatase YjhB (NUDIX family)